MSEPDDRAPKYPPPKYPPPNYPPPPPQSAYQLPPQTGYQPAPGYYSAPQAAPNAYWPLTIVAFLMSCLIGGVSLYFSYQVGERTKRGDLAGATNASKMAKIWGIVGIVVGAVFLLIMLFSGGDTGSRY